MDSVLIGVINSRNVKTVCSTSIIHWTMKTSDLSMFFVVVVATAGAAAMMMAHSYIHSQSSLH